MVEKNVIGMSNAKDIHPEKGYDGFDEDSIARVAPTNTDISVAAISSSSSRIDPIAQWRSFSEQLKARRLARLSNESEAPKAGLPKARPVARPKVPTTDQQYQSAFEHDELDLDHHGEPMLFGLQRYLSRVNDPIPDEQMQAYESPDDEHETESSTLNVAHVMSRKVVCVIESTTIEQVASLCNRRGFTGVPVVNQFQGLVGIVTLSDVLTQLMKHQALSTFSEQGGQVLEQRALAVLDEPVRNYMHKNVITVSPETSVKEACRIMDEHKIRRVVVTRGDLIKGIFSAQDAVRVLAKSDIKRTDLHD